MVPERGAWVDAIRRDWRSAELSPRQRALCNYAAKLTCDPGGMQAADLEPLRAAGLEERAILDLAHVVGFFAYANRIVEGLGCDPEK